MEEREMVEDCSKVEIDLFSVCPTGPRLDNQNGDHLLQTETMKMVPTCR